VITYKADSPPADRQAGFLTDGKTAPRILWVIWDEWDYRLTFLERNKTLSMPAIDRFRQEAFFAENALPPGTQTMLSLPSLIDGRRVVEMTPVNWDLATLRYAGSGQTIRWGSEGNVFSKARAAGFNTALIGWYLPYCRLIGQDLSSCFWIPQEMPTSSTGTSLPEKAVNMARTLLETQLFSVFGQSLPTKRRADTYHALVEHTEDAAKDHRLGLVFLHIPVPHSQNSNYRRTGTFTLGNHAYSGYIDNLALLDRTVGEFRETLEKSGDWNRMTIVFSADHPYRSSRQLDGKTDSRVPFLVRFPGQTDSFDYSPQFNTVGTSDMLLAILQGEVASSRQLAHWLDLHRDTTMVKIDPKAASKN